MEPNPVRGLASLICVLFRVVITLRQNNLPITKVITWRNGYLGTTYNTPKCGAH